MRSKRRKRCKCCRELFESDPRNRRHQKFCKKEQCRKASKTASQRRWCNRPENQDYFIGQENVARVKAWRTNHPKYWKRRKRRHFVTGRTVTRYLTPKSIDQPIENTRETGELALQELLAPQNGNQPLILIGLISKITGITLQDDIANASRNLLRLGQDV